MFEDVSVFAMRWVATFLRLLLQLACKSVSTTGVSRPRPPLV